MLRDIPFKNLFIDDVMEEHNITIEQAKKLYDSHFNNIREKATNNYWDTISEEIRELKMEEIV